MAVCEWCKQEMLEHVSCTTTAVEFPDGSFLPSVPFVAETEEQLVTWYNNLPEFLHLATKKPDFDKWYSEYIASGKYKFCHDCGTPDGGYHHPGCDAERCPICSGQLISCGCLEG